MTSIQLKHHKSLKKLSINKNYTSQQLGHLIVHIFQLKDKLVGVTDQDDRYYDLEYLAQNLKFFKAHTLTLVTYKEVSEDNMSFASSHFGTAAPEKNSKEDIPMDQALPQQILQSEKGYMGHVETEEFFENIFLEEGSIKILVKSNTQTSLPKISIPFYSTMSQSKSVVLYDGFNKLCELFVDNFENINEKISSVLGKINVKKSKQSSSLKPQAVQRGEPKNLFKRTESIEQCNRPITADYSFEIPSKETVMQQLKEKLDRGEIGELEYFKLKCNYYEHPEQFAGRRSDSERESSISIDDFRQEIIKSREERMRYQRVLNSFQKPSREVQNRNSEIPIIVRRNNNVIQKISTSYPISPEQEHSIHLIAQLELKGLVSEAEAKFYKSLVLYDNNDAYSIFTDYFNESIDQIELSKRLKALKRFNNQQTRVFDNGQPEPLSKLIQKTCSLSNINLLTKLLVECDEKVLSAYDSYLLNRDEGLFGQTGNKIASFYRLKQDLEHLQEARFDNKKRKTSYKPNITY